eukprot:1188183-Prorocentrum_minimum.AAC.2
MRFAQPIGACALALQRSETLLSVSSPASRGPPSHSRGRLEGRGSTGEPHLLLEVRPLTLAGGLLLLQLARARPRLLRPLRALRLQRRLKLARLTRGAPGGRWVAIRVSLGGYQGVVGGLSGGHWGAIRSATCCCTSDVRSSLCPTRLRLESPVPRAPPPGGAPGP